MEGILISRRKKEEQAAADKRSTRQLIGVEEITSHSLITTSHGELVFFMVKPNNLSTLSNENISARIYALMTVLKGMTDIEMLCLNSRENFEDNKRNLRERMEQESNPVIRKLLEQDLTYLDRIQIQMATARAFFILVRLWDTDGKRQERMQSEIYPYLNRIEKSLKEQGFAVHRASDEDIKRLLAVYFEQNVTTEQFEDIDGERWVVLGES